MKMKFVVERYFCSSKQMEESMNDYFNEGYYPKEIKLDIYQDKVDAVIIYELEVRDEIKS